MSEDNERAFGSDTSISVSLLFFSMSARDGTTERSANVALTAATKEAKLEVAPALALVGG